MLVEDDQEIARMYERSFRFSGYTVELFHDGESALDYLRKSKELPQVIIMDVIVPKMSGLDLLRNIKQEQYLKNIPTMILTNSFRKDNAEEFLSLGADMYLVKIEHKASDIVEKIRSLINIKSNNKK